MDIRLRGCLQIIGEALSLVRREAFFSMSTGSKIWLFSLHADID